LETIKSFVEHKGEFKVKPKPILIAVIVAAKEYIKNIACDFLKAYKITTKIIK